MNIESPFDNEMDDLLFIYRMQSNIHLKRYEEGYDPATGKKVWRETGEPDDPPPRPTGGGFDCENCCCCFCCGLAGIVLGLYVVDQYIWPGLSPYCHF
jgi:hypothetical protein